MLSRGMMRHAGYNKRILGTRGPQFMIDFCFVVDVAFVLMSWRARQCLAPLARTAQLQLAHCAKFSHREQRERKRQAMSVTAVPG